MEEKVLDHGYVYDVESWGSDEDIIEAARMSTSKGFQGWEDSWVCQECRMSYCIDMGTCKGCGGTLKLKKGDMHLLRYLWTHDHLSPFEMAGLTVEVQAPIFVFREWQRHRTQSFNELSGRYSEMPDLFYIPFIERLMQSKQSTTNKQGSQEGISAKDARLYREIIMESIRASRDDYDRLIEFGVSREVARIVLPLNQYSRMRASANLRNWLHFLKLRLDTAAQYEIIQYAEVVQGILEDKFPRTMQLFNEEVK